MLEPGVIIYFVRHGETDWNAAQRTQGHTDIALNQTGRAQALANGRRLAALIADPSDLDYVASPLLRAQETMRIMRQALGLPADGYRTDAGIKEINFGSCEGQSWPGYVAELIRRRDRDGLDPWSFTPPGGESYACVWARAERFFASVSRNTVVVAHGGISRCLHAALGLTDQMSAINLTIPQDRIMVIEGAGLRWV